LPPTPLILSLQKTVVEGEQGSCCRRGRRGKVATWPASPLGSGKRKRLKEGPSVENYGEGGALRIGEENVGEGRGERRSARNSQPGCRAPRQMPRGGGKGRRFGGGPLDERGDAERHGTWAAHVLSPKKVLSGSMKLNKVRVNTPLRGNMRQEEKRYHVPPRCTDDSPRRGRSSKEK